MNKEEIIQMLRASCDKDRVDPEQNGFWVIVTEELEAFAKLVAEHEREECAKLIINKCINTLDFHGFDDAVPCIRWMAINKFGVKE